MTYLTKKEILAQLRKLGLKSASELHKYFREYEEYSTLQNLRACPPKKYPHDIKKITRAGQ